MGTIVGPSGEVRRALRHLKAVMPATGLRFSTLQVALAVGTRCVVVFAEFVALGCNNNIEGNCEVLKSPVGGDEHREAFCAVQVQKQPGMIQLLAKLQGQWRCATCWRIP